MEDAKGRDISLVLLHNEPLQNSVTQRTPTCCLSQFCNGPVGSSVWDWLSSARWSRRALLTHLGWLGWRGPLVLQMWSSLTLLVEKRSLSARERKSPDTQALFQLLHMSCLLIFHWPKQAQDSRGREIGSPSAGMWQQRIAMRHA